MPGLGTSFGQGGATTAQQDLANADCVLIEGSSMAEAHPVGFRWVMKAKERGATVIHVDPRFSRTSALADIWVPMRAGGDIAFLGGLVRHIIENNLFFRDYVVHFTNASCILREDFRDTDEGATGFFSGWNEEQRTYDKESWLYEGEPKLSFPERDLTLQHPRCVFQTLRRHFARYTPEMVEKICGISPVLFHKVADALVAASGPDKTAAICYALGWTQHSKGVQIIRTASILQLLLGNIGRPGGGILALRGHASIQGSTDIPTLYDILPGYLPMPRGDGTEETLRDYLVHQTKPTGLWHNFPAYFISLLKAYYGKNATPENEFGYKWVPKITGNHSFFEYLYDMADGKMEGMFMMGQNPAVAAANSRFQRTSLSKLKWLVVREMVEIEAATFWRDSPEIERGELQTEEIETEVFLFPAAGHAEKAGAFTNTQRLLQWREKAVDPPGDARSDAWFMHQLALRLIAKAKQSSDPLDEPLRTLNWWYPEDELGDPKMEAVLAEINGWYTDPQPNADGVVFGLDRDGNPHHGPQVDGFPRLKADGSTASGGWIYSGVLGPDKINKALSRNSTDYLGHGWGFAWPGDRRIIYNRASASPTGEPWSERKKLIWWDKAQRKWTGVDVPDFPPEKSPEFRPTGNESGLDAIPGDAPFMLHEDGLGWLHVPQGLQDGPMPTHYEPLESPVRNALYSRDTNPVVNWFTRQENRFAPPGDPRFPFVLTTYRLTEHHTAGGMSRFLSHLAELQPELFAEMSPELAVELKIDNGDYISIVSLRGAIEARALVSRRIRPMHLNGKTVHQIAMPFHFGSAGPVKGGATNDLVPISGEPNVTIMEAKALAINIVPGRLPRGPAFEEWIKKYVPTDGPPNLHPEQPPPGASPGPEAGGHGEHGKIDSR
ncbi:MAG TPA: formate dehydrogenase-N subunit alpha [Chthoniobacterales bacterium]|nr:formate dehydrogenase-N subunit alpha [Chthoniobacterales bacterium]